MEILFFWVGLIFAGIGLFILWSEFFPGYETMELPGKVVGYTANTGSKNTTFYRTVAQFKNIDGQDYVVESSVGSNMPMHAIGEILPIRINKSNPTQAHLKTAASFWMGVIFFIMGAGAIVVFFHIFKWNALSIMISLMVTIGMAYKLIGSARPDGANSEKWKAYREKFKKAARPQAYLLAQADQINWCQPEDLSESLTHLKKSQRFAKPILAIISAAAICGSYALWNKTKNFLQVALRAEGQIIELQARHDSNGTIYTPIVEYTHEDGKKYSFKHSVSSSHPSYQVGDEVSVLYVREAPTNARIDAGPLWNYLVSILVGAVGLLFAFFAATSKLKDFGTYTLPDYARSQNSKKIPA